MQALRLAPPLVPLLVALALLGATPALASHMQSYGNNPWEHDDLGSSAEPDFFGVTNVLGVPVEERAIDTTLDGRGQPSASFGGLGGKVLAPGCTDASGRQPNGLCGLYTVGAMNGEGTETGLGFPPRTLGVAQGPSPGAFGAATVRFLDGRLNYQVAGNTATNGAYYIELNKKVEDAGAGPLLAGLDPALGGRFILYQTAMWAWYGQWQDKNGNGVIDHLQADRNVQQAFPVEDPANEFQWFGNCRSFNGVFVPGWHCFPENMTVGHRVEAAGYVFPGNHHSYCGLYPLFQTPLQGPPSAAGDLCGFVGGDLPGAAPLCLLDAATYPVSRPVFGDAGGLVTVLTDRCYTPDIADIDANEADWEGDPVFGVQDSVAPDEFLSDRSGDEYWDTRHWLYGATPVTFYDQSLVVGTAVITVVDCADEDSARLLALHTCRFVDVDLYRSWSPALESLLVGLKPAARSQYEFLRDSDAGPVARGLDGQVNHRRTSLAPVRGPLDDAFLDPGFAREPDHPLDVSPGALHNVRGCAPRTEALHHGWCNDYAAHTVQPLPFVDARLTRAFTYDRAVTTPFTPGCVTCSAGPGLTTTMSPEPLQGGFPRPAGDHGRSLGPGGYYATGAVGLWYDRPQVWTESYLDLDAASGTFGQVVARTHLNGPDGWVGNVVNATGAFPFRGYGDEVCTTEQGAGTRPYAECHPYLDGDLSDPQQFGAGAHGEWAGACARLQGGSFRMLPEGGVWTVPVFVWEQHRTMDVPGFVDNIRDLTGSTGPIELGVDCGTSFWSGVHFVYLPLGNLGLEVRTEFSGVVDGMPVRDVDAYRAWGA